jgi:hypothetical protein
MPFNVLLLPLLGGYIFLTNWNRTRFNTKRYSGERLLFHAAVAGVLLLAASFLIVRIFVTLRPELYRGWRAAVPFPYTGTSFGAFLIGSLLWLPLNRLWFPMEKETRRAINEWNDYLEVLLERALRETRQVSVSTRSSKVYIGFVTSNFDPAYERKFIRLLPTSSGYRDSDTQELVLTTDYAKVYQQIIQQNNAFLLGGVEDFQIVIPVAEIASANLFDPSAYQRFQEPGVPSESAA